MEPPTEEDEDKREIAPRTPTPPRRTIHFFGFEVTNTVNAGGLLTLVVTVFGFLSFIFGIGAIWTRLSDQVESLSTQVAAVRTHQDDNAKTIVENLNVRAAQRDEQLRELKANTDKNVGDAKEQIRRLEERLNHFFDQYNFNNRNDGHLNNRHDGT